MKLDKLTLRNFKWIKSFTLNAGCSDVMIMGDNATGKTTIVDAVSWLLFDKDSLDQKQFEIKPLVDGKPVTNTEVEVEAIFVNGSPLKLRKVFKEKWTKPRGKAVAEFTGNTTDYYVDDVPAKAGEYKAKVAELATREEIFKLLTSPAAFPAMHWQKQRELLLEVCGNITDEDVIAANQEELSGLPAILDGKTCDERKKIIAGTRKKINDELKSIPDRIDEAERSRPELTITNPQALVDKLGQLHCALSEKNDEISNLKVGGGAAKVVDEIAAINSRLSAMRDAHESRNSKATEELRKNRSEFGDSARSVSGDILLMQSSAEMKRRTVNELQEINYGLAKEYDLLVESNPAIELDCPTCGQRLPEGKIAEAVGNFNQQRSEKLESINSKGVGNKQAIDKLDEEIKQIELDIRAKETTLQNIENDIANIEQQIAGADSSISPIEADHEFQQAIKQLQQAEQRLAEIKSNSSSAAEKAEDEKKAIETEIAEANKHMASIEQSHRADDRIAELKAQEKKLAKEFEKLEGHLFLIEQFIRAKVSMLEERINDNFELVSFRLFKEQINEGLQEVCEVTINGVPYSSLNSAGRIQAGLDIIKTMSRYYKFAPFIFIDNRESITSLPEMDTQVISLVVSEMDKELRIESNINLTGM